MNSITAAKVRYTFKRRNGINVDNLIIEKTVDVSEVVKKIEELSEHNL